MRATRVLLATEVAILLLFFFWKLADVSPDSDAAGVAALGAFALLAAGASLYLLSKSITGETSSLDWLICICAVATAVLGFAGYSITFFGLYLFFRDRGDLNAKAAGSVVIALAVQAVWAPLLFSALSFLFLQIDAGMVGWLVGRVISGASWTGMVVTTPSGHDVIITAPCASFHNLSLASLCWVTLTMLQRPYWVKSDIYVGLGALAIQFGLNICRLVFVCMSLPMYEFWHEGAGKHIFSGIATAGAIVFVQILLSRDQESLKRRRQSWVRRNVA